MPFYAFLNFLHILVFVGPDVFDGDLANYEDGLSSGQAFLTLHGIMVEQAFCYKAIYSSFACGINLMKHKEGT